MKQIILQSLSLINFKGIRSLDIHFDPAQTYICGENGTGKTTVFDAFCWCLFGKDSLNRADSNFNIKTLDENGSPILKQEHSVTCVLLVGGNSVKLQRKYCEVWTKPRGTTEETLTNHKTEFLINDVKQSTKKDYDAEISAIIPEDVFKMITNPFTVQTQVSFSPPFNWASTKENDTRLNIPFILLSSSASFVF